MGSIRFASTPILEDKGANIASAATVDLSTASGNFLHITGTTTITSFGTVDAGAQYVLVFDGALTLSNNATISLPGGANIATAAGDVAVMRSEGSGNWRCVSYTRANGTAVVGAEAVLTTQGDILYRGASGLARLGAGTSGQVLTTQGAGANPTWGSPAAGDMTLLSVVTASNSATVDLETTFDSTYDAYMITVSRLVPASTLLPYVRLKVGGAYATSGYYYAGLIIGSGNTDAANAFGVDQAQIDLIKQTSIVTDAGGGFDAVG